MPWAVALCTILGVVTASMESTFFGGGLEVSTCGETVEKWLHVEAFR